MTSAARRIVALAGSVFLAACAVGPDYERPTAVVPADYKEQAGWKAATPRDEADRGDWWSVYRDLVLDGLLQQIDVSNQNLKAAEAAYRQSVAIVRAARASFLPTLSVGGTGTRSQAGSTVGPAPPPVTLYNLDFTASWEPDLWGRIRRTVESDVAGAQASAADIASARLSAQSALAADYFQLRVADALKGLLDETAAAFAESLRITRNQYAAGTAAKSDVAQAETQLESTQAQAVNVGVGRAQLEHAIALLVGKAPADFAIAPAPFVTTPPVVPTGLPSTLLERRPDIAAAERSAAAANALIGVAIAAYFPDVTLSASVGSTANTLSTLAKFSNPTWSYGAQIAETLLDFGVRSAQVEQSRAAYDQAVAVYRQTVLTGFQQVEDQLAALRILEQQAAIEEQAVASAKEAERLILNQYKAGTVAYTAVVVAQAAALSNEQTALAVLSDRLVASVALIQALGGGWETSQLPTVAWKGLLP
jgi:NodT family efflux transporter outer membrane factor (OMF) lipoprotein